ncbi:hypothetical protein QWY90_02935 [Flavobacterium paronense]|uniref:Lipocalin-like domain-containing protein n=1 Tax=Flavobacterium paronense TaxID=1392775 RepID=A0ABV5GCQ8_9FLAO|nr:hypothetical protein [Flavobacterium paronense]MDN3676262.1 hypothetical protein [Flavobacterium paronense]
MKNLFKISMSTALILLAFSCKTVNISPKQASITVPAKGAISIWQNIEHASFSLHLENKNTTNSCEAYTVKNNVEKWISPSLLADSTLDFTVPTNGSVLLKNFSNENLTITYTIE